MTKREDPGASGWTGLKVIGLILALIAMVSSGLCGILGVTEGALAFASFFLALGVGFLLLAVKIVKSTRRKASRARERRPFRHD